MRSNEFAVAITRLAVPRKSRNPVIRSRHGCRAARRAAVNSPAHSIGHYERERLNTTQVVGSLFEQKPDRDGDAELDPNLADGHIDRRPLGRQRADLTACSTRRDGKRV